MSEEEKANSFMQEAQKKSKSLKGLFGGTANAEEACQLYTRAANSYKMAKNWTAAGKAFTEVAKLQSGKLKRKHESANQYVEAANCYKKGDFLDAIKCLEHANEIYNDMGKFSIVAKHNVSIAEIYEKAELSDIDKAVAYYTEAADYYKSEQSTSSANKCLVKIALYAAQKEDYRKAITIYEEVAKVSLESSLLKYSAKEYLFRSALCNMCDCMETNSSRPNSIQRVLERYAEMYPAFESSREAKFLEKLVQAHKEDSAENFTKAVNEYNKCTRLDKWYTIILSKIKGKISNSSFDMDGGNTKDKSSNNRFDMDKDEIKGKSSNNRLDMDKDEIKGKSSNNRFFNKGNDATKGKSGNDRLDMDKDETKGKSSSNRFFNKGDDATKGKSGNKGDDATKGKSGNKGKSSNKGDDATKGKSSNNRFNKDDDTTKGKSGNNPFDMDDDPIDTDDIKGKSSNNNPFDIDDEPYDTNDIKGKSGNNPFDMDDGDIKDESSNNPFDMDDDDTKDNTSNNPFDMDDDDMVDLR